MRECFNNVFTRSSCPPFLQDYLIRVAARNQEGLGFFSEWVEIHSLHIPDEVTTLAVVQQGGTYVLIQWNQPVDHGSDITEYDIDANGTTVSQFPRAQLGPIILPQQYIETGLDYATTVSFHFLVLLLKPAPCSCGHVVALLHECSLQSREPALQMEDA